MGVAGLAHTVAGWGKRFIERMPDEPAAAALPVPRLQQQAFANVVKHAGASETRVDIASTRDLLVLEVVDHGQGALRRGMPG